MYDLIRPLLFALDAETAHRVTLYGLDVAQRSNFIHLIAKPPAELPTISTRWAHSVLVL
jgi:dihydroorotate dehydrogenase